MGFTIPRPDWVSDRLINDPECGPNAGFQMYTREGNDQVAHMILQIVAATEEQRLRRDEVIHRIHLCVSILAKHYPEVWDTEPHWAIVDAVNAFFDTQGWVHINTLGGP
jgi:hypothetical protein